MSNKNFWLTLVGMAVCFAGGFLLANSLNRNEIATLQAQQRTAPTTPNQVTSPANSEPELSDAEIKQKIAEADKDPNNVGFQKDLGIALYRYGIAKQNTALIEEAVRLLKRADEKSPRDFETVVTIGNALFDIAAIRENKAGYKPARDYYQRALEIRPDDPEVRADFGSTYFLGEPIDIEKAQMELKKALEINAANERALQFLTQVYIKQGNRAEADKTFAKLKSVNPSNPMIKELTNQIATGKVD